MAQPLEIAVLSQPGHKDDSPLQYPSVSLNRRFPHARDTNHDTNGCLNQLYHGLRLLETLLKVLDIRGVLDGPHILIYAVTDITVLDVLADFLYRHV